MNINNGSKDMVNNYSNIFYHSDKLISPSNFTQNFNSKTLKLNPYNLNLLLKLDPDVHNTNALAPAVDQLPECFEKENNNFNIEHNEVTKQPIKQQLINVTPQRLYTTYDLFPNYYDIDHGNVMNHNQISINNDNNNNNYNKVNNKDNNKNYKDNIGSSGSSSTGNVYNRHKILPNDIVFNRCVTPSSSITSPGDDPDLDLYKFSIVKIISPKRNVTPDSCHHSRNTIQLENRPPMLKSHSESQILKISPYDLENTWSDHNDAEEITKLKSPFPQLQRKLLSQSPPAPDSPPAPAPEPAPEPPQPQQKHYYNMNLLNIGTPAPVKLQFVKRNAFPKHSISNLVEEPHLDFRALLQSQYSTKLTESLRLCASDIQCNGHCTRLFNNYIEMVDHYHENNIMHFILKERHYRCPVKECPLHLVGTKNRADLRHHVHYEHIALGYVHEYFQAYNQQIREILFVCTKPECNKCFYRSDTLTRHLKLVHVNEQGSGIEYNNKKMNKGKRIWENDRQPQANQINKNRRKKKREKRKGQRKK